jgi:serine/threonine-protein kinase
MASIDTDRNLLFGVLALQGELIDSRQFAEACTAWAAAKDRPLAEHLIGRGWLSQDDRQLIEKLLERRINKHAGDAHQSLIAAACGAPAIAATLGSMQDAVGDKDCRESLADFAHLRTAIDPHEYLSPIGSAPESRDRYTLTRLHAKGGIGQVWLARDTKLSREVALKELRPERSESAVVLRRFLQEARITGQLDHPGVVPVYELAETDAAGEEGHPYYTMRFIRGRTLTEAIAAYHAERAAGKARRTDRLALVQAFLGVCNTVAFAHSRGVIHRDLKGQNIILGEFGEVVLLDWGLAKLLDQHGAEADTEREFDPAATVPYRRAQEAEPSAGMTAAGQVLGTPAYMAPEQAAGQADRIGRLTDVYGLGAMLYEILAGRPPFDGTSTKEVLRKICEEPAPTPRQICPTAPRALEAICQKAMQKVPEDRYPSAGALAADVQHWIAGEPVSAWREPWPLRAQRWVGRHRVQVAAGVAALSVFAVGLTAAVAIEARANTNLNAALERQEVARGDATEQARQAESAIDLFYNGITEDVILRRPELAALRGRLLGAALQFYEQRVRYLQSTPEAVGRRLTPIAMGLGRIASLQAMLGDRDKAIQTRRQVVEIYDKDPTAMLTSAADAVLDLGNLERLSGRPADAVKSLREALARLDRLRPKSAYAAKIALAQSDLGRLLFDLGRSEEAHEMLDAARQAQEVLSNDPKLYWLKSQLAATHTTLGNAYEAERRMAEANLHYQKALDFYQSITATEAARPYSPYYQAELARALNNYGLAQAQGGKLIEGERAVERGREIRERLSADQPLNIESRADLARSYYHLARVQLLSGNSTKAIQSVRKAEELYTGIPPKGPEDIYFQAGLKALRITALGAGKSTADMSVAELKEQKTAADEAMALLKKAALAGYSNPVRIKNDPPLESLRSRADFQELIGSLGKTTR